MVTKKITLDAPERFAKAHTIPKEKLEAAAKAACAKLKANAEKYGYGFPGTCSVDYKYVRAENKNWECGMYTGCFWLAYELTGDEFFRNVAEEMLATYRWRIENKVGIDDHDVGFAFMPSCIGAYKVFGSEKAKSAAIVAVEYYYDTSYSEEGKFIIRSHKSWSKGSGCRTMIDSMMNASLLFWAGEHLKNEDYSNAAKNHSLTAYHYIRRILCRT